MMLIRRELLGAAGASQNDPYFENVTLLLHGDGTNGGQNNTFISTNSAAANVPGGYGVYFDGSNDYLTAGSASNWAFLHNGASDWTIEFWTYYTGTSLYGVLSTTAFTAQVGMSVLLNNTNFGSSANVVQVFITRGDGSNYAAFNSSAVLVPDSWNYVAITFTSSTKTCAFYINGSSAGSSSNTGFSYVSSNPTNTLSIGRYAGSTPGGYIPGYLSNIRVSNVVRSGLTSVPSAPLASDANTSLLTCQSATFIDNSSNNYTITAFDSAAIASPSNSGMAITRNGNTTQGSFSPYGDRWSNYFDGTGDSLTKTYETAWNFGSGNFTIEGWFNSTSSNQYASLLSADGSGSSGWALLLNPTANDGKVTFYEQVIAGSLLTTSTGGYNDGNWHHFALVRNGSGLTIYIDGISRASSTVSGTTSLPGTLYIGNSVVSGRALTGYISNVRIVKGTAVYTGAFTPPTTPLTAITNTSLLTCQSNRFVDNSSNNFTITRNGDVSVQRFSPFSPTSAYSTATIGGSGYFDGTGDYITCGSTSGNLGSGDFTVECWMYCNSLDYSYSTLISNYSSYNSSVFGIFTSYNSNGKLTLDIGNSTIVSASGTPLRQWTHVAVTRSSNTVRLFVNGVSQGSITKSGTYNGDGIFTVGSARDNPTSTNFTGFVSNARVVVGTAVYTADFTPPTTPLTAITNTSLLCNFTNASIFDNAMMADLETVGNAQIDTAVKKFGSGSLEFDGDTDCLSCPRNEALNISTGDFTIEFWAYWNAFGSDKKYVISLTDGSNYWQFRHDSTDGPGLYITGFTKILSQGNNTGWSTGTWYHVALVRSGSSFTIYRNGTSVATGTSSSALGNFATFGIGGIPGYPTTTMSGYLDDVRITKGIARYTSNFTPPTAAFPNK